MALILPKSLQKEHSHYTGEHNGSFVVVIYDEEASGVSSNNLYAVFSKKGFHGWLNLGWSKADLIQVLNTKVTGGYEGKLKEYIEKNNY